MKRRIGLILLSILTVGIIASLIVLSRTEYRNILFGTANEEKKAATTVGTWDVSASGSNVTATLDSDGTLTFTGTGAIKDYTGVAMISPGYPPYSSYQKSIKKMVFSSGITRIGNHIANLSTNNEYLESVSIASTVTEIGDYAFIDCESLTSVTIPSSVKTIGKFSFMMCSGLTSITIPNSVTTIDDGAFYGCTGLTTIEIPSSVKIIGEGPFRNCTNLRQINVNSNNTNYSSEGGVLFNKSKTVLIEYPTGNSNTTYTVPSTVTTINNKAFSLLLTITNGNTGVTTVSNYTNLQKITIPRTVTTINDNAFSSKYYNTGSRFTIRGYRGSAAQTYANAKDITFEAIEEMFAITLNNQGATSAGTDAVFEIYGEKILFYVDYEDLPDEMTTTTNPLYRPSKTGYTFGGYYTQTGGNGTQMINANGYITPSFTNTYFTSDSTLYAKWTANEYTITLNNQSATSAGTGKIYETYASKYSLTSGGNAMTTSANAITKPSRAYTITYNYNNATGGNSKSSDTATYTFGGYYTSTNGSGTQYIGTNGYLTSSASNTNFTSNGTLYAKWTSASITLPTPTRTGYTFGGWYSNSSLTTSVGAGGASYTPTTDGTLYAKWTMNEFTITLNNQSATTAGTGAIYETYGSKYSLTSGGSAMTTSANAITKPEKKYIVTYNYNNATGGNSKSSDTATYTFGGYYTSTNGGGTQYIGTTGYLTSSASNTNFTSNGTLYAKWTSTSVTLPTPTRTGYTFEGWYSNSSLTTSVGVGGSSYTPTADGTLYAKWTANTYTITLNNQSATSAGTGTIYETYESKYSLTNGGGAMTTSANAITKPTRAYTVTYNYNNATGGNSKSSDTATYTFGGYYTSANGGGTQYIGTTGYLTSSANNTNFSSNGTLYAKWTTARVTLPTPTRTGYTFGGWYSNSSLTTSVGTGGTSYTPSSNVTLYAKWTIDQHTLTVNPGGNTYTQDYGTTRTVNVPEVKITLDLNDGSESKEEITAEFSRWELTGGTQSGSINSQTANPVTYTYGTGNGTLTAYYKKITVRTPTRAGYTFDGWYTSQTGGTKESDGDVEYEPTQTKTLYAHWVANSDTTYKVEHYLQRPNGTYSNTPFETEDKTGTTDTEVTAEPKNYPGYTEDEEYEDRIPSGNLDGDGNLVLKLYYSANTDTGYTVEHYLQDLDESGYTKDEDATEDMTGITGDLTAAEAKIYQGFIAQSFEQEEIAGDGTTVIKIYYNRSLGTVYTVKHYLQNLDDEDEYTIDNTATEQKTGKTGAQTEATAKEYSGFTVQEFEQEEINGDGSTVINIYYNRNTDTRYIVEYYLQNIEDDEYTQDEDATEEKQGKTGAQTEAEAKEYIGFLVQEFEQEEIKGDGSTVIKIYYNREVRTVTFENYDGEILEEKTIRNEGNVEYTGDTPIREEDGYVYEFIGWDKELDNITEDTVITAEFDQEVITYNIEYKNSEKIEGIEFEEKNPTTYTVETEDFTLCNPTAQGYTFVGWKGTDIEEIQEEVTINKGSIGDRQYEMVWKVNNDTPYKVEHYKQQENGEYPQQPSEVEELKGTTKSNVTAKEKNYEGYELDTKKSTTKGIIEADGSLVLKLYYKMEEKEPEPTNTNTNTKKNTTSSNITTKTYGTNTDNTTATQVLSKTGSINLLLIISTIAAVTLGIVLVVKEIKIRE